jgi:hypothetical protein
MIRFWRIKLGTHNFRRPMETSIYHFYIIFIIGSPPWGTLCLLISWVTAHAKALDLCVLTVRWTSRALRSRGCLRPVVVRDFTKDWDWMGVYMILFYFIEEKWDWYGRYGVFSASIGIWPLKNWYLVPKFVSNVGRQLGLVTCALWFVTRVHGDSNYTYMAL